MILEHFRITNLFSYYGPCEFDLTPNEGDNRNIILIWGRNGYGKTSFINSLKLLLGGVSSEMCETVHSGRKLNRDTYLLGMGDEWSGVFNRYARKNGASDFGVSLTWREEAGTVTVERNWKLDQGQVSEELHIHTDFSDPLKDINGADEGEARAFIQARLPDNILPFFVYDGEKVQQIAEANREGYLRQIEQLLDLKDVDLLDEYLSRNLTKWRKASNDASQHRINSLEFEIKSLEEKISQIDVDIKSLKDEEVKTAYDLRQVDIALESRRQFALLTQENNLAIKRENVKTLLEESTGAFFETFTREAPLALHPKLMQEAVQELEKITSHPNRRLKSEVERIFSALPERLLTDPPLPMPPLTENQEDFLYRKLVRILESYRPDDADLADGLFSSLSPTRAESLLRIVDDYVHNNQIRTN